MMTSINSRIRDKYVHAGFLQQQKAVALAWICVATIAAILFLRLRDVLHWNDGSGLQMATNLPMLAAFGLALLQVIKGRMNRSADMLVLVVVLSFTCGSILVARYGQIEAFFMGFGLYPPVIILANAHGLKLGVKIADGVPGCLLVDDLRLRQILTNLLGNAIKFTQSGSVLLAVRHLPGNKGAMVLQFAVEDTGIGMPAEVQERIFNRFSQADESITRRFGGTGLGLAISKMLAHLMGGDLEVESVVGTGSRFLVSLPMVPCERTPESCDKVDAGPSTARRDLKGLRILLVDDNATNRRVAEGILQRDGCVVTCALDGLEALAKLEQGTFDLVLMDCHMPGMDGMQATVILRSWKEDPLLPRRKASMLPVVALTASATSDVREECDAAGMNDLLVKPYRAEQLRDLLGRWSPRGEVQG
jgi:CheY-like chemotaxis protein